METTCCPSKHTPRKCCFNQERSLMHMTMKHGCAHWNPGLLERQRGTRRKCTQWVQTGNTKCQVKPLSLLGGVHRCKVCWQHLWMKESLPTQVRVELHDNQSLISQWRTGAYSRNQSTPQKAAGHQPCCRRKLFGVQKVHRVKLKISTTQDHWASHQPLHLPVLQVDSMGKWERIH